MGMAADHRKDDGNGQRREPKTSNPLIHRRSVVVMHRPARLSSSNEPTASRWLDSKGPRFGAARTARHGGAGMSEEDVHDAVTAAEAEERGGAAGQEDE